jgi:Lamin Tail Domain/Putative Ig domain
MAQDDWFELFNASERTVDLSGYHLTDDPLDPAKFRVPTNGQYRIAPRGFLLVFADNQTAQNSPARSNLHTNFKLSTSPGFIGLYRPDGLTPVDEINYAQQIDNVSEGRYADGATNRYSFIVKPTPSGVNSISNLYNSPPIFPAFPDLIALPGQSITINIRAHDPDGNALTYTIVSAPPGSQLNPSGLYRWIVPANQPPGDFPVTLRVTDNGVPARSDTAGFTFTVPGGPGGTPIDAGPVIHSIASVNGQAVFTINTRVGRSYRILYKDDLNAATWSQLDRDFVAANATASISDSMATPVRFYQIQQLD